MPPLTFRSEDEEAQYCLSALRDGTHEEKIVARERLSSRGAAYDEVAELYELNIRAGVRSPEVFEDLARLPPSRRPGERRGSPAEARRVRSRAQRQPAQASDAPSPPTPGVDSRVIPFPSQSPSVSLSTAGGADRTRAQRGLGVSASTAAALTPQVATQLAPDAARSRTRRLPSLTRRDISRSTMTPTWKRRSRQPTRNRLAERRPVPGPLLVVGVVLFMIVLPVTLLALFVVNPLSLYLEGRRRTDRRSRAPIRRRC